MKKLIGILIASLLFLSLGCSPDESGSTTENVVKTVNVETKLIQKQDFQSKLRVVGSVKSKNDIMISAEVNGRVVEHSVSEGANVRKGDVIIRIDDSKLKQEKARLEAATSQAREQFERLQQIYEQEEIGSEIDVLNAKYAFEQSKAALESLTVDMNNTKVVAPFDGRVEAFLVEEGEMASPGVRLVRLIGSNTMIVSMGVPARYSNVINEGDDLQLWFDSQRADTLSGKVTFVGSSIDPLNRTFKVEALLPPNIYSYKVDMIANVILNTLNESEVIVVSEEFIFKEQNDFVVYVKSEDEAGNPVSERRTLELGPSYRSNVIVRSGLEVGDELITIGAAFLNDGMRLNIVETADPGLAQN